MLCVQPNHLKPFHFYKSVKSATFNYYQHSLHGIAENGDNINNLGQNFKSIVLCALYWMGIMIKHIYI